MAGVNKSTYYRWLEKGRAGKIKPYSDFLDAVEKARQKQRLKMIQFQIKAIDSWQALAWFLERKNPKHRAEKTIRG